MALAYMGALDPATASKSQARDGFEVRLPGIIYGENSVQILVWPHGKCDTRGLFRAVAARFGLRSLSRLPGCSLVASSKTHNELLDTKLFDGPGKFTKPSTWFKGADGITETWTEYYQLPFSQGFWRSADVDLGPPMPSHIIATGYTWYVEQIGDFETRVALTATNPMTCKGGRWVPDDVKCARQFAAATRVAEAMREELVQIKPKKRATLLRQMVSNLDRSTLVAEDKHGESCGLSTRHHNGPGPGPLPQSLRNGSADMIRWDLQGQ